MNKNFNKILTQKHAISLLLTQFPENIFLLEFVSIIVPYPCTSPFLKTPFSENMLQNKITPFPLFNPFWNSPSKCSH